MTPHTPHSLPGQIVAVMAGTILVFALTLALSVLWLIRTLDQQARVASLRLAHRSVAALLTAPRPRSSTNPAGTRRWSVSPRGDRDWLYANMGATAVIGAAANLVVAWVGPVGEDLGWLDRSPPAGMSGLAGAGTLWMADARLAALPHGAMEAATFFAWRGNDLFVAAAARVERALAPPLRGRGSRAAS